MANANHNGHITNWAPILGRWDFDDHKQEFLGEGNLATAHGQQFAMGLAISNVPMASGSCKVNIRFGTPFGGSEQVAGVVIGYRSPERPYIFAELGAGNSAYSVGEYTGGLWRPLARWGQIENLQANRDYTLQVSLSGQNLRVLVDGVPMVEYLLSRPIEGKQVGLIAAGNQKIAFSDFAVDSDKPKAFVVMKFAEPFDTLYREVIQQRAAASGFEVVRGDEMTGPGVIFQDVQRKIEDSDVVIAEVTVPNPNVFYELGYAQALKKPTILLAQLGTTLPFDIQSYRVVFYSDTIGGKAEVEQSLQRYLEAIKRN